MSVLSRVLPSSPPPRCWLKGTGVSVLWPQLAALFLYGTLILGASALRFRKRLD